MSVKSSRRDGADGVAAFLALPAPRWQGGGIGPLWTVFTLTLRQFLRGKRALVVLALALLPAGLALLVRSIDEGQHSQGPPKPEIEFVFLFYFIPHTLLPLTALLYGSGLILDEQEDQTLTYLLVRPLPKWGLYVSKLLAAICMVSLLVAVFVPLTYMTTYLGSPEWWDVFPKKIFITLGLMILAMITYVAVFGAMSLFLQRSLIIGLIYIGIVEGLLSNFNIAIRQLTVMYYFRVLSLNWLDLDTNMKRSWQIVAADATTPLACVLTLLIVTIAATIIAVVVFSRREFYVKTPETN
jgi:ABC-2 type transport system permease protein